MMFTCPSKKCKGREVPLIIKEIPDNEKPGGVTAIAYRVRCYLCDLQLRIISQTEYLEYMGPPTDFVQKPNPNTPPDFCYKCGIATAHTVPPTSRLIYDGYGKFKMACLNCEPYSSVHAERLIVLSDTGQKTT